MFGLTKPSLTLRIGLGKLLGLIIGIAGFIALGWVLPEQDMMFRIGVLFWYTTLGAMIGLGGIYNQNPIFAMRLPWWLRGAIFGAWFNLLLMLFVYEELTRIMTTFFGPDSMFTSAWWIVVEGAIIGFVLDGILTTIAGDGPQSVDEAKI